MAIATLALRTKHPLSATAQANISVSSAGRSRKFYLGYVPIQPGGISEAVRKCFLDCLAEDWPKKYPQKAKPTGIDWADAEQKLEKKLVQLRARLAARQVASDAALQRL